MAAKKYEIAELAINDAALIKSLTNTKASIDDLTKSQKALKLNGDTSSETFVKQEAQLKSLKSEYGQQVKVLQATTGATKTLNTELNREIKSVDQAVANNKELRKVRNQLNDSTEEGAKAIEDINSKMDANNKRINDSSSSLEKQKQNIGNYPDVLDDMAGGLGGVAKGFMSSAKAGMAFIMTPIGAVIGALVGVFLLVKNAMDRSEDSTNKIKKAFSAFSGITNALLKILKPLGDFLIDGIAKGFELVEKAVYTSINVMASALDSLGFDEKAKSLREFNAEVQQGAKDSKELADAEAKLTKAQRESRKIQLDYQKDAEKLRQVRDDENKSLAERAKANKELGDVLKEQGKVESEIANQAIKVANLRIKIEGETTEALDARADAETELSDIQERIVGQESEQLSNLNGIRRDAADKAKQIIEDKMAQSDIELELYKERNRQYKQSDEEALIQAIDFHGRDVQALKNKLSLKLLSETEYQLAKEKLDNELEIKKAESEEKELTRIKSFEDRKTALMNEIEAMKAESAEEKAQLAIEKEYEDSVLELERMQLMEDEKTALMLLIKDKRDTQFAQLAEETNAMELEANQVKLDALLEQERTSANARYSVASRITGALMGLLGDSLAAQIAGIAVQAGLDVARVNIAASSAASINLAKAAAVGFPANLATIPAALGQNVGIFGSAAAASGKIIGSAAINAVTAGISSIKKGSSGKTFAKGGILSGASHANGGIKTPYGELEGDEIVLTKGVTSNPMLRGIASQLNVAGGGVDFAGGIRGTESNVSNGMINYDLLAAKVAQANMSLPSPIVTVEEINTVGKRVSVAETNASF